MTRSVAVGAYKLDHAVSMHELRADSVQSVRWSICCALPRERKRGISGSAAFVRSSRPSCTPPPPGTRTRASSTADAERAPILRSSSGTDAHSASTVKEAQVRVPGGSGAQEERDE